MRYEALACKHMRFDCKRCVMTRYHANTCIYMRYFQAFPSDAFVCVSIRLHAFPTKCVALLYHNLCQASISVVLVIYEFSKTTKKWIKHSMRCIKKRYFLWTFLFPSSCFCANISLILYVYQTLWSNRYIVSTIPSPCGKWIFQVKQRVESE